MIKKRWRAIINPTSGTRKKSRVVEQLNKHLDSSGYELDICFTKGPTHATDLAREAAEMQMEAVLAVGGDGTVNETATGLLHSNTALGIVPLGSGNGLARHLLIPATLPGALSSLKNATPTRVDVCTANGHPFFNVAGVGYDAVVAHDFAERPTRGFATYLRSAIGQYRELRPRSYQLEIEGKSFKKKAMMISVANGSQYGNNAFIAPGARLDDGLMDLCILYRFPAQAVPLMAYQLFNKALQDSRFTEYIRCSEFTLIQKSKKAHLDGEPYKLGKNIHFKVLPKALNILAPQNFLDEH